MCTTSILSTMATQRCLCEHSRPSVGKMGFFAVTLFQARWGSDNSDTNRIQHAIVDGMFMTDKIAQREMSCLTMPGHNNLALLDAASTSSCQSTLQITIYHCKVSSCS